MLSVAAALSFALVRTGTSEVMTCLRSAFSLYFGVEFRAVAGQVEQLDFLRVLGSPSLYRFAVMNAQVIQPEILYGLYP